MNARERYKVMRREADVLHGITRAIYRAWERRERRKKYMRYIKSPEWQIVRAECMLRAKGVCEDESGCRERAVSVHHEVYPLDLFDTRARHCKAMCKKHHRRADTERRGMG